MKGKNRTEKIKLNEKNIISHKREALKKKENVELY